MLSVVNCGLFIEHVLVLDVLVQITEVAHMFSDLGLRHLNVQRLLDPRQILRLPVVILMTHLVLARFLSWAGGGLTSALLLLRGHLERVVVIVVCTSFLPPFGVAALASFLTARARRRVRHRLAYRVLSISQVQVLAPI